MKDFHVRSDETLTPINMACRRASTNHPCPAATLSISQSACGFSRSGLQHWKMRAPHSQWPAVADRPDNALSDPTADTDGIAHNRAYRIEVRSYDMLRHLPARVPQRSGTQPETGRRRSGRDQ